ncbi:DUF7289 family protein [Halorientalis litorea]|uniref:DUF7289 family protein n=1 Tax=Halorientalis litorea TaxID=2931977 RepID=UPI001FF2FE4A|nr:hypothetical protein [Halorientalis litorea]
MTGRKKHSGSEPESDRAVSDLVGFVLAFAVIITSVALVSTFGFGALEDAREAELATNTERSFVLLGQNFKELETGTAERRTSEIELRSGSLRLVDGPNMTFEIHRSSGPNFNTSVEIRRLQYRISGEHIGYESGATFRGAIGSNSSIMQVEPGFTCGDGHAVVSVVRLTGNTERIVSGGVARISGRQHNSSLLYPENRTGATANTAANGTQLNVTINSTFDGGWGRYFTRDENGWEESSVEDDTYVCDVGESGVVYIRRAVLGIEIER